MTKHMTQLLPIQSLASGESAANLASGLKNRGIQVFYLDGREICDKRSFLHKVAEAMKFPD